MSFYVVRIFIQFDGAILVIILLPQDMKATKTLCVQNYQTQEEIKHCLAITLFLKMLQDFMAATYTCRPQITAKGICRRT